MAQDCQDNSLQDDIAIQPGSGPSLALSMAKLASGRAFGAAVAVVMMPIVYRLYDDRSVGIMGFVASVVAVTDPCTNGFCYLRAMPLTNSAVQRRAIFVLSALLGSVATLVLSLVFLFGSAPIATVFGKPELGHYLWVVSLFCVCSTFRSLGDFTLSAHRMFGTVAIRETVSATGCKVVQAAMGVWPWRNDPLGMLWGALVASYTAAFTFSKTSHRLVFSASTPFRWSQVADVARRFRDFPRFRFWSEIVNMGASQSPAFVLAIFFPLEVLGAYSLARLSITQPLRLFASASRDVFYVEAADRASRGQKAADAALQLLLATSELMAFPLMILVFLGPPLFPIIFGSQWREAGVYAQILAPWVCVSAVGWPLLTTFDTSNKLGEGLVANLLLLVAQTVGLVVGSLLGTPKLALIGFVATTVFVWAGILLRTLRLAGVGRRAALRATLPAYVEATLLLLPAGLIYWVANSTVGAILAVFPAAAVQLLLLHRHHPRLLERAKRFLNRRANASDTADHGETA